MDVAGTIVAVTGAVGAIGSAGLGGFWLSAKQNKRDEFRMILDERKGQLDEVKNELQSSKRAIEQLEKRIEGLENAREEFPFPMWQSDLHGRYVHVNRFFIERVLAPQNKTAESIMGGRHEDIWSAPVCDILRMIHLAATMSHDKRALKLNVSLDLFDNPVQILKVPDYTRGILVGHTGYIVDVLPDALLPTNH